MPNSNHRILRERAKELCENFKKNRKNSTGKFRNLPDGFTFPVEVIRNLVSHPNASHFVVQFGWKDAGGNGSNIAPVLFVTDTNYQAIPEAPMGSGGSMALALEGASAANYNPALSSGRSGGFVDEGNPIPPPDVSVGF